MSGTGSELEVFSQATNWKQYWHSCIWCYLRGDVLEVGAGIGSNTLLLRQAEQQRWVCLEPEPSLALRLEATLRKLPPGLDCEVVVGTVSTLPMSELFDAIVYIDVLEHIENDVEELALASKHLREGGVLAVLAPAHQWLFTRFDRAIGHHRRYVRKTLIRCGPENLVLERLDYLDSAGLIVSSGNRFLLKQSMPTPRQIWVWDRWVVPVSRLLDPLLLHKAGKSLLAVWRKPIRGTAAVQNDPPQSP